MCFHFPNINSKYIATDTLQYVLFQAQSMDLLCVLLLWEKKHALNFGFSYLTCASRKKYMLISIKMSLSMNINAIIYK